MSSVVISFKLQVSDLTEITKLKNLTDYLEMYTLGNGIYGVPGRELHGRITIKSLEIEKELQKFIDREDVSLLEWNVRPHPGLAGSSLDKKKWVNMCNTKGGIL